MKEIWSAARVYEYLKNNGYPLPKEAYCTRSFSWKEVLIRQTEIPELIVVENLLKVVQCLQKYRLMLFKSSPITITSGWRSDAYNKKIGGAGNSYHISGMALDFNVSGYTPQQVQAMLDPVHRGGMEFAPDWTHVDIRDVTIRFDSKGRVIRK